MAALSIGQEKKFELTNGTYYDLLVKLNSINTTSSKANLTIKSIHEEISATTTPTTTPSTNATTPSTAPATPTGVEEKSWLRLWIVMIVVVILIVLMIYLSYKKKKKF